MAKQAVAKVKEKVNWPITIALIVGLVTIIFPLWMAVRIADVIRSQAEDANSI